jgi:hypothetical protein
MKPLSRLFRKQEAYSLDASIPCKKGKGCSVVAYKDLKKFYRLDEPDHFCTCLTEVKKGKEKTLGRFLAIKVNKEAIDMAKITFLTNKTYPNYIVFSNMKEHYIVPYTSESFEKLRNDGIECVDEIIESTAENEPILI